MVSDAPHAAVTLRQCSAPMQTVARRLSVAKIIQATLWTSKRDARSTKLTLRSA